MKSDFEGTVTMIGIGVDVEEGVGLVDGIAVKLDTGVTVVLPLTEEATAAIARAGGFMGRVRVTVEVEVLGQQRMELER